MLSGEPLIRQDWPTASVMFGPDGHTLATVSQVRARLWTIEGQSLPLSRSRHRGRSVHSSMTRGKRRQQLRREYYDPDLSARHVEYADCAAFSPDGRMLAVAGHYDCSDDSFAPVWVISLWDAVSCRPIGEPIIDDAGMPTCAGHTEELTCVAFSPDGRTLASTSHDGTARLWDVTSGRPQGLIYVAGSLALACAFSPDGRTLATADDCGFDDGGIVEFWDPASRQEIGEPLVGHTGAINSVVFSPDGRLLATAGDDGTARLWVTASREELGDPLTGHGGAVKHAVFSPDGRVLATAGNDGTARLWCVADRQQIGEPLTQHTGAVNGLAFSPDGRLLATAGDDGTVRLWDTEP